LVASVLLGLKFGAVGVAWGTLIGAFVGMLAHVFYNLPRTKSSICVSRWEFVKIGILQPSTAGIPICLAAIYAEWKGIAMTVPLAIALALSMCVSLPLLMRSVPQFRGV
jgi:Na+-driven multidrug efflux pump